MSTSLNHTKTFVQSCHDKHTVAISQTLLSDHVCIPFVFYKKSLVWRRPINKVETCCPVKHLHTKFCRMLLIINMEIYLIFFKSNTYFRILYWKFLMYRDSKIEVKVTLIQALRLCRGRTAYRGSTRRGWSVRVTPWPLFTPGKNPVHTVQEVGWATGLFWTGAENLADSIPGPSSP